MSKHIASATRYLNLNLASDIDNELASNEQTLLANDYPQDRGIFKRGAIDDLSHSDFFGEPYLTFLQGLSENDLFVHVGPGDFFAEVEYFSSPSFKTRANVLSNAYSLSTNPEAAENLRFLEKFKGQGKFTCVDGIKFQDLKSSLKGKAKLIADVFAAGSYDRDLFGVFKTASEMLVPGGMFAVVLASVSFQSENGRSIPVSDVYESFKGFELVHSTSVDGWVFKRTEEVFLAPKSEIISFVARDKERKIYWPVRQYRIS